MSNKNLLLSNGSLAVNLNESGAVYELYFPFVGGNNALMRNALPHKVGLFADGAIHWLDDGTWNIKLSYYPGRPISHVVADNPWLNFRVEIQDFVDYDLNVLVRNFHVINTANRPRHAKLYLYQSFVLSQHDDDTVEYLPAGTVPQLKLPAICHYGQLAAYAATGYVYNQKDAGWSGFSVGRFGNDASGENYMAGTWYDAADGGLSGNPIEHGLTDSIMEFNLDIAPLASARVCYHLAAGADYNAAVTELSKFAREDIASRLRNTNDHWAEWIKPALGALNTRQQSAQYPIDLAKYINDLVALKAATDNHGAVISDLLRYECESGDPLKPLAHPAGSNQHCQVMAAAYAAPCYAYLGYTKEVLSLYNYLARVQADSVYFNDRYRADCAPIGNRHALVQNGKPVSPVELDVVAMLILGFNFAVRQALQMGDKVTEWKSIYKKLIAPLATKLANSVDHDRLRLRPSYRSWGRDNDYSLSVEVDAMVQRALYALADLADEQFKDDAGSISYRMAAEAINVSPTTDRSGRSPFTRALDLSLEALGHSPIAELSNFLGIRVEEINEVSSK